jgi:hypothetical protein
MQISGDNIENLHVNMVLEKRKKNLKDKNLKRHLFMFFYLRVG